MQHTILHLIQAVIHFIKSETTWKLSPKKTSKKIDICRSSGSSSVLGFVFIAKVIKKQKPTKGGFFYGLLRQVPLDKLRKLSAFL